MSIDTTATPTSSRKSTRLDVRMLGLAGRPQAPINLSLGGVWFSASALGRLLMPMLLVACGGPPRMGLSTVTYTHAADAARLIGRTYHTDGDDGIGGVVEPTYVMFAPQDLAVEDASGRYQRSNISDANVSASLSAQVQQCNGAIQGSVHASSALEVDITFSHALTPSTEAMQFAPDTPCCDERGEPTRECGPLVVIGMLEATESGSFRTAASGSGGLDLTCHLAPGTPAAPSTGSTESSQSSTSGITTPQVGLSVDVSASGSSGVSVTATGWGVVRLDTLSNICHLRQYALTHQVALTCTIVDGAVVTVDNACWDQFLEASGHARAFQEFDNVLSELERRFPPSYRQQARDRFRNWARLANIESELAHHWGEDVAPPARPTGDQ